VENFVAIKDGGASAIFKGLGENAIAVVVVAYKQIVIAVAGWRNEAASLVGVHLASRFHDRSIAEMGAFVGRWACWCNVVVGLGSWWGCWVGRLGSWDGCWFGGALILAGLIEMAFNHWDGWRRMFA
jgi:hypothetical protein